MSRNRSVQVIGLDVGHSAVKMTYDAQGFVQRYMFPAIAAPAIQITNQEEAERAAKETVTVRNRDFFVGTTAAIQARGSVSAGLSREWLHSAEHMALIAHAKQVAYDDSFDHLVVILGLPITEYAARRESLEKIAMDVFGENIQTRVLPQPMGTYQEPRYATGIVHG